MSIEMEEFKDRAHVSAEIKKCAMAANIATWLAVLFAVIGIVSDWRWFNGGDRTVLETSSWFLLAVFAAVMAIMPHMHVVVAKHLLGTETIKK
jgi:hypothetical protein